MRSKNFLSVMALLLEVTCAATAQDFKLNTGVFRRDQPDPGKISTFVFTSGTPPAPSVLEQQASWAITASPKKGNVIPINQFQAHWDADTKTATLIFDTSQLSGATPSKINVLFTGANLNLTIAIEAASPTGSEANGDLSPAKGKDDADLYLFGSYLAGVGTKPIFVIDGKLNWLSEIEGTGWSWGVNSTISTNANTQAPVNRTQIDPDSVDGSLVITKKAVWKYFDVDLRPIGGEFSRKYPASDLMTKGYLKLGSFVEPQGRFRWFALYPSVGYELGRNLNKPNVLFKQPVNLSGWNTIAQAYFGATGEFYGLNPKPDKDGVYRFTLDSSYQARVPFTEEPYVVSEYVKGNRVQVTSLRKNTRHEVEAGFNWNFNKYAGFRLQYRYGALPPLFEFVDHQVTVGLTFKATHGGSSPSH